jgi:hypothetical protein
MRLMALVLLTSSVCLCGQAQQHPRDAQIHDADTLAWWHTTEALSGDDMEGRDTGSAAYQRAAEYVAERFKAAGLQQAGDGNTYFQSVAMHEIAVDAPGTSFVVERQGGDLKLDFLQEITIAPGLYGAVPLSGAMTFRGYCGKDAMADVAGKFVICYGARRAGMTTAAERLANARAGGALGILNADDLGFIVEPQRWPEAYARSVSLVQTGPEKAASAARQFLTMRISALAFSKLIASKDHEPGAFLMAAAAKLPLPSFDVPGKLTVTLHTSERDLSSPNVLAVLPGSDQKLRDEYVVVAAHLDGYGYGTPVNGDKLYNGTLDDAAYVALLIQMADDIKAGRIARPKRSILFCAFTGEEKGLLGSNWFVEHPTVPLSKLAADVNLDQLRPLFPLNILTALAVDDTSLGQTVRDVGKPMGIEIRADREPERGLLRRADHYPFLKAGVPAIGFIFGYDAGTDAEKRYREWYQVRYHRPQDDLTQPVDFDAAAKFDQFFYKLVGTIGNAPERPKIMPGSSFASKP